MYPPELVKPMREDLTRVGFYELHTANDVEEALKKDGTTLVVVNSVCGCAAAGAFSRAGNAGSGAGGRGRDGRHPRARRAVGARRVQRRGDRKR